ncbi:MAG: cyclophilin-like fold protein [Nitrososphaerota archaeon]|nr:cyclophilin-like fold protein [Nitrososphaerota archaeon]
MVETKVVIEFEGIGAVEAVLKDEVNPKTYSAIVKALPFESEAETWGEEVYFTTPVSASLENGKRKVEKGDVGYWPPGKALCLFFGRTPASTDDSPVAASPVNVVGKIIGGIELLKKVKDGVKIKVRLVQ